VAITFDPAARRVILDSAAASASEIWSRWTDWATQGDNLKHPPAMRQLGGDSLGGSLLVPIYIFLLNGWRVRPMESNHTLSIVGNLFVEEGGSPVVNTIGAFNVSTTLTVPVQAQGYNTGGSAALSPSDIAAIAAAVWNKVLP